MTAKELASVLLKMMGLYWMFAALLSIPNLIAVHGIAWAPNETARPDTLFVAQLLTVVFTFGIGVTLLAATPSFLRFFASEPSVLPASLNSFTTQAVGLSLLGAGLLAVALPNVASSAVTLLALSKAGRE